MPNYCIKLTDQNGRTREVTQWVAASDVRRLLAECAAWALAFEDA